LVFFWNRWFDTRPRLFQPPASVGQRRRRSGSVGGGAAAAPVRPLASADARYKRRVPGIQNNLVFQSLNARRCIPWRSHLERASMTLNEIIFRICSTVSASGYIAVFFFRACSRARHRRRHVESAGAAGHRRRRPGRRQPRLRRTHRRLNGLFFLPFFSSRAHCAARSSPTALSIRFGSVITQRFSLLKQKWILSTEIGFLHRLLIFGERISISSSKLVIVLH